MKVNKQNVVVLIVSCFEKSNDLSMIDNILRNTCSWAAYFRKLLIVESIWIYQQNLKLIAHWNLFAPVSFHISENILGLTLFPLHIHDLPDAIYDIAIYADDTTLCSKSGQASYLWQQPKLASELESDLWDTVDWGRKWLVDFNAGKIQLVSFDWSNNTGAIDVKMDGSVLEEKSSFKMFGLTCSSKLDWGSYTVSIAKTASKKIGALIRSMKLLSPEVALYLYKSTIRPCVE